MSAFVVNDRHIDYMLAAGLKYLRARAGMGRNGSSQRADANARTHTRQHL
jgi:hypothetical protein